MASADVTRGPRPDYPEIGEHLRARRHERGLSLRELAHRLGVSPSLISQIERGRANPSVSTLYQIVAELDVSLDELLFEDRRLPDSAASADGSSGAGAASGAASVSVPAAGPVLHSKERQRIRLASGVIWERLTTVSEPGIEFLYVIYEVGGASSPEDAFQRHAGHEWGYVLSGSLQVTVGFRQYLLEPGDSLSLESTTPHRLANAGDTPVHAIWFVLGRDPHDTSRRRQEGSSKG
jgi:DNA-binding XRE family transcriptional regulator/quercetin dioxygenase-like cupin family protein